MAAILSKKQKKRNKYSLTDLKTLGHQLLSSRTHINNLPILLTFISPSMSPQYVLESLLSLQSFFTPLLPDLPSSSSKSASVRGSKDDTEFIYKSWLRSKFDEFVKLLIDVVVSLQSEETLKEVVLDSVMEFVKMGKGGKFQSAIYHRFINSVVQSDGEVDFLLNLLATKYFSYMDVCYFTYISVEKIVRTMEAKDISDDKAATEDANNGSHLRASMELSIQNIHNMLSRIPPLESLDKKSNMWSASGDHKEVPETAEDKQLKPNKHNSVLSVDKISKRMKLKFTKAWISFLRLPLPLDVYKEVLVTLHQAVIPHLSSPIMLCDFLTRSYDIGGVVSVMALSGLFILMTQHGLEYPNFYEKLYALMIPSIFMAKHRAKFFELLDSCLKSPLLPAYLASAFAKKLSRLALSVPPSGALVIIALIHNLLRRHPSINCLVHREDSDETANEDSKPETKIADGTDVSGNDKDVASRKRGIDSFNNEESDPIKSSSMRSSLWEIDTLRHHYCPPVSRFVLSLENDLTVRAKTTEMNVKDFSSGSYATIFGDEIRRRVKQVPLAFYKATPTSLFSESDFPGWTFNYQNNEEICAREEEQDHGSTKRQRIESL